MTLTIISPLLLQQTRNKHGEGQEDGDRSPAFAFLGAAGNGNLTAAAFH
jgi:hypothetical protein